MKNFALEVHASYDLEVHLLGRFALVQNGQPLPPLASRKADAVIAYLALQNAPVAREQLATLLWSAEESGSVVNNLRVVLSNIRRDLTPYVQITRKTVEFDANYKIQVDALMFREMVAALDLTTTSALQWLQNPSAVPHLTAADVQHLEDALSLYTDHLLNGFRVLRAPDFETWLTARQEGWRQLRNLALDCLVMHYLADGQYGAGLKWARQLVDDDPLNKEPQHKLITLLAQSGQNHAALEQYEGFIRLLQQEMGAEPDADTVQLHQLLLAPTTPPLPPLPIQKPPRSAPPTLQNATKNGTESGPITRGAMRYIEIPNNIRAPLTTFVGRENELAHVQEHLALPARRLITLIGPGGMGKTRLATQVAHRLIMEPTDISMRYRDGVYFVPLAAIQSHTQLIPAIAAALNINLQGAKDAKEQVWGFLHYKHLLLILDNFEHLVESAVDELLDILERAPNLAVLVTSRIRLQLSVEHLIPLHGLPYHLASTRNANENGEDPILTGLESQAGPATDGAANGASLLKLDHMPAAYHLFADAAMRTDPDFTLTLAKLPSVSHICALTGGTPLGIELAAALVDQLSCAEIARQIERTLDALETTMRDVPLRHRSLRAVFEHSWSLLSAAEQMRYAQLAIFQHGFSADAAAEVASLAPPQLQNLVNKSLVQNVRDQTGQFARYEIHGVLLPYLTEKLAAQSPVKAAVTHRHSVYYASLLAQWNQTRQEKGAHNAIEIVQYENANLQAAWESALAEPWLNEIEQMVDGLAQFYLYRGPFDEAVRLFASASVRLRDLVTLNAHGQSNPNGYVILSSLLSAQSAFLIEQGEHNEAIGLLQESIALLQKKSAAVQNERLAEGSVLALHRWGKALLRLGKAGEAQGKYTDALQMAETHGLQRLQTRSLLGLGTVALLQGDYPLAQERYAEALTLCRAIGDGEVESSLLVNLGIVHQYMGDYSQAKVHYESGLAIERASGNRNQEALSLMNLGTLFHHVAAYEQAQFHYTDVLKIYQQMGKRSEECRVLANLALLLGNTGDHYGARRLSNRALTIARAVHQLDLQAYALTCLGHALTGLENWEEALAAFNEAVELRLNLGQANFALEPKAGMAFVCYRQNDLAQAHMLVDNILQEIARVGLAGVIEPNRIRWICYQILRAANDNRAHTLLRDAYEIILTQAAKISEPDLRTTFLENSPIRRTIIQEFEKRASE